MGAHVPTKHRPFYTRRRLPHRAPKKQKSRKQLVLRDMIEEEQRIRPPDRVIPQMKVYDRSTSPRASAKTLTPSVSFRQEMQQEIYQEETHGEEDKQLEMVDASQQKQSTPILAVEDIYKNNDDDGDDDGTKQTLMFVHDSYARVETPSERRSAKTTSGVQFAAEDEEKEKEEEKEEEGNAGAKVEEGVETGDDSTDPTSSLALSSILTTINDANNNNNIRASLRIITEIATAHESHTALSTGTLYSPGRASYMLEAAGPETPERLELLKRKPATPKREWLLMQRVNQMDLQQKWENDQGAWKKKPMDRGESFYDKNGNNNGDVNSGAYHPSSAVVAALSGHTIAEEYDSESGSDGSGSGSSYESEEEEDSVSPEELALSELAESSRGGGRRGAVGEL